MVKNMSQITCIIFSFLLLLISAKPLFADRFEVWSLNINSQNEQIKKFSIMHLGNLRDKRALPLLLKTLHDPSVNIRLESLTAIAKLYTIEGLDDILVKEKTQEKTRQVLNKYNDVFEILSQIKKSKK